MMNKTRGIRPKFNNMEELNRCFANVFSRSNLLPQIDDRCEFHVFLVIFRVCCGRSGLVVREFYLSLKILFILQFHFLRMHPVKPGFEVLFV